MAFDDGISRGRKKNIKGNQVVVRRYTSTRDYKRKDKNDKGQCRITIPRPIADLLNLEDNDIIEFKQRMGFVIIEKVR